MDRDQKAPRPDLTIVGGQPRGDRVIPGSEDTEIPVGFEMLLYRAARDPEFKQQLLADRQAAAAEWGVKLRPSEQATLAVVSDEALSRMIDRIEPSNPQRRRLMSNVAAAVTSLAAGTVAVGLVGSCDDDTAGGTATATTTTTTTPPGTATGAGVTPSGSGGTTTTATPPGAGGAGIGPGGLGGFGGEPGGGGVGGGGGSGG